MEEEIKINQPSWLKRLPRRPRGKKSNYQIRQILKGFELRESAKRFRVRVTGTAVPLSIHSKELKQPWEKAKRSGNIKIFFLKCLKFKKTIIIINRT